MRKLFERTVRTAVTMKLVDLAVQAVDGTKVVANASVNRSYDAEGLRRSVGAFGECDKPTLRLRTKREKALLLPICLRSWPIRRS